MDGRGRIQGILRHVQADAAIVFRPEVGPVKHNLDGLQGSQVLLQLLLGWVLAADVGFVVPAEPEQRRIPPVNQDNPVGIALNQLIGRHGFLHLRPVVLQGQPPFLCPGHGADGHHQIFLALIVLKQGGGPHPRRLGHHIHADPLNALLGKQPQPGHQNPLPPQGLCPDILLCISWHMYILFSICLQTKCRFFCEYSTISTAFLSILHIFFSILPKFLS